METRQALLQNPYNQDSDPTYEAWKLKGIGLEPLF